MRNFTLLLASIALVISASCSKNESTPATTGQQNTENKLDSYTLKKDANGNYSIGFNIDNKTQVDSYILSDNLHDIVLSQGENKTNKSFFNSLVPDNNSIKVNLSDSNNSDKKVKIFVEDEDVDINNSSLRNEYLNNYCVTKNKNGTFTLNFEVNENTVVNPVFNQKEQINEFHCYAGKSEKRHYSFNIKSVDGATKIDFINYSNKSNQYTSRASSFRNKRKPRILIDDALY